MRATAPAAIAAPMPRQCPAIKPKAQFAIGLEGTPTEVGRARSQLARTLHHWSIHPAIDAAILVVSELVSNSVRHTTGEGIELIATHGDERLLIEVWDSSSRPPVPTPATDEDEGGRGLALVDTLSLDWGWAPGRNGTKRIWAVLTTRPAETGP